METIAAIMKAPAAGSRILQEAHMLPGRKFIIAESKPAPALTDESAKERYGGQMRAVLKRELESFANSFDLDLNDVLISGAQLFTNGYLPVLGKIPCGPLSEAIAQTRYYEVVPPYLKPSMGDYILEADGDSMSPKIEKNDLVVLRPDIEPSNGEICAVQIYWNKDESTCKATLKKLYRDSKAEKWILKPINIEHEEIEVPWREARLEVIGVYRGHITKK